MSTYYHEEKDATRNPVIKLNTWKHLTSEHRASPGEADCGPQGQHPPPGEVYKGHIKCLSSMVAPTRGHHW